MTRPFRFAVQGGPLADVEALPDFARHVESLGYEKLYSYDHIPHYVVRDPDGFAPVVAALTAQGV
jgi:hypothetical protein